MDQTRYKTDLTVTTEDIEKCNLQIIFTEKRYGYYSIWKVLSSKAKKSAEDGEDKKCKIYWLLADVCSMMLSPQSINEPFKPMLEFGKNRSAIADDFSEDDIIIFSKLIDKIDDIWLKARLSDFVWLKNRSFGINFALQAIDLYKSIPLDLETWLSGGKECWERSIVLCRILKSGAGNRIKEISSVVFSVLENTKSDEGYFALWLAELLNQNMLGREKSVSIANKLKILAMEFDAKGEFQRAESYFSSSSKWFEISGDKSKYYETIISSAEILIKEANSEKMSVGPNHLLAAHLYDKAIKTYRKIPKKYRQDFGVEDRIVDLRRRHNEANRQVVQEMTPISIGPVDISELADIARDSVRGKNLIEAIRCFLKLFPGANYKKIRDDTIKLVRRHPLHSVFPLTLMGCDGRTIAKCPTINHDGPMSNEDEANIRYQMVQEYSRTIRLVVHGYILPALEILLLEHHLREVDFIAFAQQSPIIPLGRERLWGRALYAGYDKDMAVAIHLLTPQLEHMIRTHLKSAGAITTNFDSLGIENENGLGTLMNLPEAKKIFGENLSFEIQSLFCDSLGYNLRNELAHGLIEEIEFYSDHAVYAWYLCFRMTYNATMDATK